MERVLRDWKAQENKNFEDTYRSLYSKFHRRRPLFDFFGGPDFTTYYFTNFFREYRRISRRNFIRWSRNSVLEKFKGVFYLDKFSFTRNGFRFSIKRDRSKSIEALATA